MKISNYKLKIAVKDFFVVLLTIVVLFSNVGSIYAATFTPGMAKRNAPGPFATAPIVQGDTDPGRGDVLIGPVDKGGQISGEFYGHLDLNQGSLVFWITPEWDGDDGENHAILEPNINNLRLTKNTNGQLNFFLGTSAPSLSVDVSSWTAGTTYQIVVRWDTKNTLNGSSYSISINDSHSYGGSIGMGITMNLAQGLLIGSYPSTVVNRSNALIEGLTIYRRPLFDGTHGIDVGNGDEIAQIYNSGTGRDSTLVTGSWDVVFALPTNSSTGALTTGTGNAWSHPHSSNLLYTSTTNTGGFMMNGDYQEDGWRELPWYEAAGTDKAVAVYQPFGAGSWEGSYTNLINPGTLDAAPLVAPEWDAEGGWTFDGRTQYLNTGIQPDSSYSAFILFSNALPNNIPFGSSGSTTRFFYQTANGTPTFGYGNAATTAGASGFLSGMVGIGDGKAYQNGVSISELSGTFTGTGNPIYIGALNNNGTTQNYFQGQILAFAAYSQPLSSAEMFSLTNAAQGLLDGESYLNTTALDENEKIFAGGYKFTSNAPDQGISYTLGSQPTGRDYVVRAIANSDGTSIPKVQIWDTVNDHEITQLTGTSTSTRTNPDVLLFTFELPYLSRYGGQPGYEWVEADSDEFEVRLLNTEDSGTTYWHQVEVLENLIDNPSLETGSGDLWIPDGAAHSGLDSGDTSQETTLIHSGSSSIRFNDGAETAETVNLPATATANNFYSAGGFVYSNDSQIVQLRRYSTNHILNSGTITAVLGQADTTSWTHLTAVVRQRDGTDGGVKFGSTPSSPVYADDAYFLQLDSVSLAVTPASLANSTENTDEIRVDGWDTYVADSSEATSIAASTGFVSFDYRPRHSAANAVKFAETTDENAYIISFDGDADDYIHVYWDSANTLRMDYSMVGSTDSGTWDATGAIAANTQYNIEVAYTGGSDMTLSVDGTDRITLSSIPSAFGTAPNIIYFGSDTSGENQGDATFSNLVFDNTAPSISLTALSPDPHPNNTPTISGTATEAIGTVSSVEFQMDGTGGSWTACTADDGIFDEAEETFTCTTPELADGEHTIYVRSTDSNGNVSGNSTVMFTVDASAPVNVELQSPGDKSYTNNERPTYRWKATSDTTAGLSKYVLEVDNGDTGDFIINDIAPSGTEDVENSKYKIVYEGFGDSDDDNNYISVYTRPSLNWSESENDGKLKEGRRSWTVKAVDIAGNETSASHTLFVDRTNPNVEIVQVNDTGFSSDAFTTTDTTLTIYGKITDILSNSDGSTADQDENGPKVASGPKSVEIRIESQSRIGYELVSTYLINMNNSWWECDNSEFSDNTKQKCNKYLPFEYTPGFALELGEYRVTLTGRDKADNTSQTSFNLTIGSFAEIATDEEIEEIEEEILKQVQDDELDEVTEEKRQEIRKELQEENPITRVSGPSIWEKIGNSAGTLFAAIFDGIGSFAGSSIKVIGGGVKLAVNAVGVIIDTGWDATGKAIAFTGRGLASLGNGIANAFAKGGEWIARAGEIVGGSYTLMAEDTKGLFRVALAAIGDFVTNTSRSVANGVDVLATNVGNASDALLAKGKNAGEAVGEIPENVSFVVKETVSNIAFTVGMETQDVSDRVGFAMVKFGYLFVNEPTRIANVRVEVLSAYEAKVTWETNHPANGKVNWGFAPGEYEFEVQDDTRVTEHEYVLSDLRVDTEYHFEVMSQNKNYVYDANRTFRTLEE